MSYSLSQIAKITGGRLIGDDRQILNYITDTRSVHRPGESLFVALVGPRHDGHDYIDSAIDKGLSAFLVSGIFTPKPGVSYVLTEDSLAAFQKLSSYHRLEYNYPVIGITGSYGKTQVKDRLAEILSEHYSIVKSPRSFNSQIGVALSVMAMDSRHDLGIFEAGISQPEEMARLQAIIKPTIGVFTSIGAAHDDGFSSRTEKLKEKLLLYTDSTTIIYRRDDETLHQAVVQQYGNQGKTLIHWGSHADATLRIESSIKRESGYKLTYSYLGDKHQVQLQAESETELTNAIHMLCVLYALNMTQVDIKRCMMHEHIQNTGLQIEASSMASGLLTDIGPIDRPSIRTARAYLERILDFEQLQVVLIDPSGSPIANDRRIEELARELGESPVYCIGPNLKTLSQALNHGRSIANVTACIEASESLFDPKNPILLIGPWSPELLALKSHLQEQGHQTRVSINLQALVANLNAYRSVTPAGTRIMAMVKAFAYGSGDSEVAHILQHHQVDYLAVAYADEGVALRKKGITLPIMVMNTSKHEYADLIRYRLEPEIYSQAMLHGFMAFAKQRLLKYYPIHLKVDTGMHRLGCDISELPEILEALKQNKELKLNSVMSHLFASDGQSETPSLQQIKRFKQIRAMVLAQLDERPWFHILNSSGISRFPEESMDMVRLGIGLYGMTGDSEFSPKLQPVFSWHTAVSQVKTVPAGETVGYGGRFVLERDTRIAILPVGYADGISRHMGNGAGYVHIKGQRCPYVGNICMDMSMVDISDLHCEAGQEVELLGPNVSLQELAAMAGTIGYEILTSIAPRVRRQYLFFG